MNFVKRFLLFQLISYPSYDLVEKSHQSNDQILTRPFLPPIAFALRCFYTFAELGEPS